MESREHEWEVGDVNDKWKRRAPMKGVKYKSDQMTQRL